MNTENSLKMSVTIPPPKSTVSEDGIKLIIGVLFSLVCSLAALVAVFYGDYKKQSKSNQHLWDIVGNLNEENRDLTNDMFQAFQITSERSRNDVWECVGYPKDLLVSPWELGLESYELTCALPAPGKLETIVTRSAYGHYWQMPGELDFGVFYNEGLISITREGNSYSLQTSTPPIIVYRLYNLYTHHLVPTSNVEVWHAVFRGCLAKIRDRDLGLSVP